ncbi:MAG: hypothetical protein IT326_06720 [Anaerolineae bacterium]|nr:hypothetical protein [Anaerolineae bacterium]
MANLNRQISQRSTQIAELEAQLGEAFGEFVEMSSVMATFAARVQHDLIVLHNEILATERALADLKALRGGQGELGELVSRSPLWQLLDRSGLSIEEQYQRYGRGQRPDKPIDLPDLPPASPTLKRRYATLVAKMHPAFAKDTQDYEERQKLFARVNKAYLARDEETRRGLAEAFAGPSSTRPAVVDDAGLRAELDDRVTDLETMLIKVEGMVTEYRYGDVARIKGYADEASLSGRDFVGELQAEMKRYLISLQRECQALREGNG